MGLGIWKFTTLVLLFVVAFMDKVQGKQMAFLESRQSGPPQKAFVDCALNWQPPVGGSCVTLTPEMANSLTDLFKNGSPNQVYLAYKNFFEKYCVEPNAFCNARGTCECKPTVTPASCNHPQDTTKDCRAEFNPALENERDKLNHGSVFGPRPQFEYMLWTSLLFIVVVNLG